MTSKERVLVLPRKLTITIQPDVVDPDLTRLAISETHDSYRMEFLARSELIVVPEVLDAKVASLVADYLGGQRS